MSHFDLIFRHNLSLKLLYRLYYLEKRLTLIELQSLKLLDTAITLVF